MCVYLMAIEIDWNTKKFLTVVRLVSSFDRHSPPRLLLAISHRAFQLIVTVISNIEICFVLTTRLSWCPVSSSMCRSEFVVVSGCELFTSVPQRAINFLASGVWFLINWFGWSFFLAGTFFHNQGVTNVSLFP